MRNDAYWAERMKLLETALLDKGYAYTQNLESQFSEATRSVEKELAAWYQRFAENNQIGLSDAKRLLTAGELKEFRWTVEEYIKYGKEHALDGRWAKELENASARVHVSRLDSIKLQLQQQAEALYGNQLDGVDALARSLYSESYLHTAFELQKGIGVGWSFMTPSEGVIGKVLSRPWTTDNQTFRDRCWVNKNSLVNSVNTNLTQMIMRGEAPDKAIKAISKQFGVAKHKAGRLVMTESAAFASAGQKDCFLELGVEKYRLVETLDSETCPLCGELDGKVFKMSEYVVGVTAPPFHPWCRGCTCPHFDDMVGERLARDAEGKHYKVADNLGFKDWKAKVVTEPALAKELFSYKAQLRAFDVKSYKGIWRDDVTTLDYAAKKAAIPMKREYFETAISNANGTAKASFEAHLVDLNDFEVNGKAYYALKDKIKSVEQAFTKLPTHGIMKENPYTIERKDAAYWFTDKAEADSILRPRTGEMWKVLTPDERSAAYDYTAGSGKFNRPLRGYDGYWSDKYYKGPGSVSLDNEGAGAQIKHLTEVLDSSSYDFDIWLQRGVENSRGASSFLGITKDQLEGSTLEQLQELLLDKVVKDEAFVSTAAAKGAGFSGYVFNVYAPRGAKMLYAEPFSDFGGGRTVGAWDGVAPQSGFGSEFEVIIQRGYSFKITKIQQTAGQFFFDVDLIID